MRFPELDRLPLAAVEAAAAPPAVLGTLLVVVLGGVAATGVATLGERLGASTLLVEVAVGLVAVATLLVLLAAGGLAVEAYRRRFRRTGGGTQLLVGLFVPAVAVVGPLAYAAFELGTATPPWWLLGIAAVGANAAALRTAAMYSTSEGQQRRGVLVGALAALPAAVGLAVLITERFLGGAVAAAGRTLGDGLAASGVPRHGLLLVVLPLGVAAAFAITRARSAPTGASTPAETSLPRSATLPEPSRVPDASLRGALVYVRDRTSVPVPAGGLPGGRSSTESSPRSSPRSDGPDNRPPVSARSSEGDATGAGGSGGASRSESHSAAGDGGGRRSVGGTEGSNSVRRIGRDRSGSAGSGSGSGGSSSGSERSNARRSSTGNASAGGPGSGGSGSGGSGSGRSSLDSSGAGDVGGSEADENTDDGGTGSDTRIFTGDFGSFDGGDDTVEHCPACEETIPSDGVYRFCPFCGEEL